MKKETCGLAATKSYPAIWIKEDCFREYPIQPVSSFAELSAGKLLLTTSRGLFLLDKNHGTIETLVEGSLAQDIVINNNTIWVATCRDGLIKYDYDKRQTETAHHRIGTDIQLCEQHLIG